jgi:hypothetical protein
LCEQIFGDNERRCGVLAKEKRYEEQTEGNLSIGWSVRCGNDDDDSLVRMGFGGVENGAEVDPGRQVAAPNIINPPITDEDIALLRLGKRWNVIVR